MNIMRAESKLDTACDQKAEIKSAKEACRDACTFALSQFAKEVERGGGNPGLAGTLDALEDLLGDMEADALVKLDEEIDRASAPLSIEYRKQGVA